MNVFKHKVFRFTVPFQPKQKKLVAKKSNAKFCGLQVAKMTARHCKTAHGHIKASIPPSLPIAHSTKQYMSAFFHPFSAY